MLEFYRALIAEGIAQGHLRTVDPGLTASGLLALLYALCREHGNADRASAKRDILASVRTVLSHGIIASGGASHET